MGESTRMCMEIGFNILYLLFIWVLVVRMSARLGAGVGPVEIATRFRNGFFLLALGDTGHVGFRVLAYAMGGLETRVDVMGISIPLVGVGALATAITVTVLYVLLLDIWRVRFAGKYTPLYFTLLAVAAVRLLVFLAPQNEWGSVVPPFTWSVIRNLPLTVLGLGVAVLMLRDGLRGKDRFYVWMAVCILYSYAFYMPVVLLVQRMPMIGMLMIPKTLAYLAMAWIGWRELFQQPRGQQSLPAAA